MLESASRGGGGLPGPGRCLPGPGRCLPGPGGGLPDWGVSGWSGGGVVCLIQGGCLAGPGGGGGLASQHALRQTSSPTVDRHTPVKTLPWPQLRCGR